MRIIDRYINNSVIKIFIAALLILTFIYVLVDVTSQLDEFIDRKVPYDILIQYYLSSIPIILVQTSPIMCLIATLFTFSNLNNNNEIIALRASGLSFWQISKPALCFGLILSAMVLFINERYVPQASNTTKKIRNDHMILETDRYMKKHKKIENLTFYGLNNRLYFIDAFDPSTMELNGITIIEHDNNQNIKEKAVALKGKWTGIAWKFFQCQISTFAEGDMTHPVKIKVYQEKLMDIKETPQDFLRQRLDVSSMNMKQLYDYIERFSNSGATKALNNLRVDFHEKISYPIGNFVIILIGIPFALMVKSRKRSTFTSIGIAIGIGFLYYVTNAVSLAFGKGGLIPPIMAAWAAPFLFTGAALLIIEENF